MEDAVATVEVDVSSPVVVDQLRRVGLQPVTLSLKPFAVPALYVPRGASRVDGVTIDGIEPVTTPDPAYLITVRNTTDVPALTVAFNTYASNRPALSGQQGDPTAIPIIEPGGTFTFRLGLRGGREVGGGYATATALDEVVVTGVIWADGRRAGDEARVMPMLPVRRDVRPTGAARTRPPRGRGCRRPVPVVPRRGPTRCTAPGPELLRRDPLRVGHEPRGATGSA